MKGRLNLKYFGLILYCVCILFSISCSSENQHGNNDDKISEVINHVDRSQNGKTDKYSEELSDTVIETDDEVEEAEVIIKGIGVEILNVRDNASLDGEIIGKAKFYEQYKILSELIVDGHLWYEVEFENNKGWIAGRFTYDLSDDDPILVPIYSDTDESLEQISVVNIKALDSIDISSIRSDDKISKWGIIDKTNISGYYKINEEWDIKTSFHNSLTIKNVYGQQVIDVKDAELIIDDKKGLMMIIYNDMHTYINYKDNIIAFEDKTVEKADLATKDHIGLYSDGTAIFKMSYYDIGLVNGQFVDRWHDVTEGDHELTVFRLLDGKLSSPNTKIVKAINRKDIAYVYSSMDIIPDKETSYTITMDKLNTFECLEMISVTDGFDSQKYYAFEVEGETKYVIEGFNSLPKTTDILRYNKASVKIEGDIKLITSSYYAKDYLEYERASDTYVLDVKNDIHVKYDEMYYLTNNYFLIKNDRDYFIYDTRKTLNELVAKMTVEEELVDFQVSKEAAVLKFRKNSGSLDMNSQVVINLNTDVPEVSDLSSPQLNVYKERTLSSEVVSTVLVNELPSFKTGDITLGITSEGPTLWRRAGDGYVNESLEENTFYDIHYSSFSTYFGEVVDEDGNVILSKGNKHYMLRADLREKGLYLLRSDSLYLYNQQDNEVTNVGLFYYVISENHDYLVTSDIDNMIRLYGLSSGEVVLLDEMGLDEEIRYLSIQEDYIFVSLDGSFYGKDYYNKRAIINISDNKLIPYKTLESEDVPVYKTAGQTSEIVDYIDLDETVEMTFIDTFEKIGDEIVLWYQVDYENKKGYIYRPFSGERPGYETYYYVILSDGTIKEVDASGDAFYFYIQDDLGKQGYLTSYFSYEGWFFGNFTNINTGEEFHTIAEPILSPDGSMFFSYYNGGMEVECEIGIYSIDTQSINEIFTQNTGTWIVEDANWDGNKKIVFDLLRIESGAEQTIIYYLEDGAWLYRVEMQ